jgi:hypothetical protein
MAANKFRVTATSASWNAVYFECLVTLAPILSQLVQEVVSDQCWMAKKNLNGRKSGGTAGIAIIEDPADETSMEKASHLTHEEPVAAPKREKKPKAEPQQDGSFSVGDVRKAAAFVNSVGGLDKAIAVLQILKVAKEVQ